VTQRKTDPSGCLEASAVHPILETYRAWVDTLSGYMKRSVDLLEHLYCEQDQIIDQLRTLCAKARSLRRSDFDAIFGQVLADRGRTRESLSALVEGYRVGREAILRDVREMFASDLGQAVQAWPELKQRLLNQKDDGVGEIVAALRQVHVEQEKISAALSGLLMRGDRLKIDDLKTVAQKLASRDSRDSAELAALLAACESAGRSAGLRWERLAG
jgi:hypothetical protein